MSDVFWAIVVIVVAATGVGGYGFTLLRKWLKVKEEEEGEGTVLQFISHLAGVVADGVSKTYEQYVKELKEEASDGKLTAEERQRAMTKTKTYVRELIPDEMWGIYISIFGSNEKIMTHIDHKADAIIAQKKDEHRLIVKSVEGSG